MLKSKDAEEAEEVAQFLVQEDVQTSKVEELLETQEYQEGRHSSLVSEQGESEPEAQATANEPENVLGVVLNILLVLSLEELVLVQPHPPVCPPLHLLPVLVDYALRILVLHIDLSVFKDAPF